MKTKSLSVSEKLQKCSWWSRQCQLCFKGWKSCPTPRFDSGHVTGFVWNGSCARHCAGYHHWKMMRHKTLTASLLLEQSLETQTWWCHQGCLAKLLAQHCGHKTNFHGPRCECGKRRNVSMFVKMLVRNVWWFMLIDGMRLCLWRCLSGNVWWFMLIVNETTTHR